LFQAYLSKADMSSCDTFRASVMDFDLARVRAFVAVAETLHFRRASEALHITQPALSRQIQALERQLGVQLLERDRRTVTLTPAGRQLLADAVPLLAAADGARRRTQRAARGSDQLVIGFRTGITPTLAIRALTARHPDVSVDVKRLEWDEQEEAVISGRVDIAYVRRPITGRGLKLIPLYTEPRLAALPIDHPLGTEPVLTMAEISSERHLHFLEPVRDGEQDILLRSVEEKLEYVAAGHGIIVLPRSATLHYTRPDIVYVPLGDAEPDEVLLACESSRRSKLLSAFIEAAHEAAESDPEVRSQLVESSS
jgi:DNA-binding transcriptional LysR family regulator